MFVHQLLLCFCFFSLSAASKGPCGLEAVQTRIINGTPVKIKNQYPWMVSLLVRHNSSTAFICGGSFIADQYILTAAHCLSDLRSLRDLRVVVGANSYTDALKFKPLEVSKFLIHVDFSNTEAADHDIGLIKLKRPLRNITPICLPQPDCAIDTNPRDLSIIGWGAVGKFEDPVIKRPKRLMYANIKHVDHETCKRHYPSLSEFQICAGGPPHGGACMGDSGGPLQAKINNTMYQIGIVSSGASDCSVFTSSPTIFERLSKHLDWIRKHIK